MSKRLSAIVMIDQVRCLRCSHRWRESTVIYRNDDSSYSYDPTTLRNKEPDPSELDIPVIGRRMTKRTLLACHNCAPALKIDVWPGKVRQEFIEPETVLRATKRKGKDPAEQALISSLFD